jgi:hypothetical protein
MTTTLTPNTNNRTVHQLFNLQDEINKIKHYYEVQQELTHTIAIVLHCLNIQSTDPLHYNQRINSKTYNQILNQNLNVPAPLSLFLFQSNHQLEIHDHFIKQIRTNQIKNVEDFMDQLFEEIVHSSQLPPLFQQNPQYQTLENYLQSLYELYQNLLYILKPKYD